MSLTGAVSVALAIAGLGVATYNIQLLYTYCTCIYIYISLYIYIYMMITIMIMIIIIVMTVWLIFFRRPVLQKVLEQRPEILEQHTGNSWTASCNDCLFSSEACSPEIWNGSPWIEGCLKSTCYTVSSVAPIVSTDFLFITYSQFIYSLLYIFQLVVIFSGGLFSRKPSNSMRSQRKDCDEDHFS